MLIQALLLLLISKEFLLLLLYYPIFQLFEGKASKASSVYSFESY